MLALMPFYLFLLRFWFVVAREPVVPEVDLGFIINAGSSDAEENFEQIKEIMTSFIDKYSMNRLRYGIISYGSTPKVEATYEIEGDSDLRYLIDRIRQPIGTPNLSDALRLGKDLFPADRPNAKRVLVLMTDRKSGSTVSDVMAAAKYLEKEGIRVISVAIGSEADPVELANASGSSENVVNSTKTEQAEKTREEIMEKVRKGTFKSQTFSLSNFVTVLNIFFFVVTLICLMQL